MQTYPDLRLLILRFYLIIIFCLVFVDTHAIVGGAPQMGMTGQPIVMILGTRGNNGILCTGTALARDLLLTAAHCVMPGTHLQIMSSPGATMTPIGTVTQHPHYDAQSYARGRVTADVALIKLIAPLPDYVVPVALAIEDDTVVPGNQLLIAGFGIIVQSKNASTGVAHMATLVVIGRPGNLQIRLIDPKTRGERAGLGACVGDSGGPVFRESEGRLRVLGVISWSTGPSDEEGCGGMTGATPLKLYRRWIVEQAKKMGSTLVQ
jgi:secreted trypsin-like serine protease